MEGTPSSSRSRYEYAVADGDEFFNDESNTVSKPSITCSGARRKTYPLHQWAGDHHQQQNRNERRYVPNKRHEPSQGKRWMARGGTKTRDERNDFWRQTPDGEAKYSGGYRINRSRTNGKGSTDNNKQEQGGAHGTRNQPHLIRGAPKDKRREAERVEDAQDTRSVPVAQSNFGQQSKSAMATGSHGSGTGKAHACESSCASAASGNTAKSQRKPSDDSAQLEHPKPRQVKPNTKTPPFTEQQLQGFLKETPSDVLSELVRKKDECLALLNQDKLGDNVLELTLRVLSRLCDLDPVSITACTQELSIVLSMVESSLFLSKHLTRYLVSLPVKQPDESDGNDGNVPPFLGMMLKLLGMFLQHKPSGYSEVSGALTLLEDSCDRHLTSCDVMEELQQLKIGYNSVEQEQKAAKQRAMEKQPPNNFRDIPIFPKASDLRQVTKPFLRKNIIRGRYENVEHYLDVQFRLLREDFVAPLREGVTEFLSDTTSRPQDIRIYNNVLIRNQAMGYNGFVYNLVFDMRPFKHVRLEASKRLLYGSFVCLTRDKFQHILCATIENRDKVAEGLLGVRFLTDTPQTNGPFIMAESAAYFEACRHVLKGLKQINVHNFPFKKYIVDVASSVEPAAYLQQHTSRMMPLSRKMVYLRDDDSVTFDLRALTGKDSTTRNVTSVAILKSESWPSAEDLHLDESQKAALQTALTREFAIIQGPPGTGKTYIGLKIIELLLHNKPWKGDLDTTSSAILVVCYTNHALDQFLEGIDAFGEKGIVRVGSRSNSEVLKYKNLSCLRKNRPRTSRSNRRNFGEVRRRLDETDEEIRRILFKLELPTKVLLNVPALGKYMSRGEYWALLIQRQEGQEPQEDFQKLLNWLKVVDKKGPPHTTNQHREKTPNQVHNEYIYVEDEGRRIQMERQLDDMDSEMSMPEERLQTIENQIFHENAAYGLGCIKRCGKFRDDPPVVALQRDDVMTDEEASHVERAWSLNMLDRWRLYRLWVKRYMEDHEFELHKQRQIYDSLSKELQDLNVQEDLEILRGANVIGMTTTGAAKHRAMLQCLGPRIVVVEEAAEVLEAHIITTLTAKCQHLILIGDHQQLRPNPTVYRLAKLFNLDTSLFERMINNGMPCQSLTHQHRMRPEMSTLMKKHFYKNLHDDESVLNRDDVKGVAHNMFFIDHQHLEDKDDDDRSKSNKYEAEVLVELCRYLLRQGYEPSQITVLTTYTGQLFCFRRLMDKATFQGIRVCVVDNFQGKENDIILLSLVRSNEGGSIGFLKTSNRVCVALSRARMGFYCIGNASILRKAPIWQGIIASLEADNRIGSSLPLVCQNHPNKITQVATAQDFMENVPCGGCGGPCEYRLPCGHVCTSWCHPYDPDHEHYECKKPCLVSCDRQHLCPLECHKECTCIVKLTKTMPRCGHVIQVFCHEFDEITCTEPCPRLFDVCLHRCRHKCGQSCLERCPEKCERALSCGHACRVPCGETCTQYCEVKVKRTLPKCGHDVVMDCGENPDKHKCKIRVNKILSKCGHQAQMLCHEDPDSIKCQERCEKVLVCGHQCPNRCYELCEVPKPTLSRLSHRHFGTENLKVCKAIVEKTYPLCGHTVELPCREDVSSIPCVRRCEKVLLACGHQCPRKCSQRCPHEKEDDETIYRFSLLYKTYDRDYFSSFCQERCEKELLCGHKCPNRCGEPCPQERPDSRQRYLPYITTKCQRQVQKKLSNCSHAVRVPCFVDVRSVVCMENCQKVLPCTHRCPNKCGEPCPPVKPDSRRYRKLNFTMKCQEEVQKKLPNCSHTVRAPCFVNVSSFICMENCEKVLPCTHRCPGKCGEPCPPAKQDPRRRHMIKCQETVQKKLPKCSHTVSVPCFVDVRSLVCTEICQKVLACSHRCPNKCSDPCPGDVTMKMNKSKRSSKQNRQRTSPRERCEVVVKKVLACGHGTKSMPCWKAESASDIPCREPCRAKLGCGHKCHGDCDSCKQGTQHKPCTKTCNRQLICGHNCNDACGNICSPDCRRCRDDTRQGTSQDVTDHQPCHHNIRHSHLKTKACIRSCNQKLQCNHPCIGVCGEPCPPLCNICDSRRVISCTLPKGSARPRDTFIYLPDCKHLCETRYLDRMVVTVKNALERGCFQLRSLLCPKCKEPIRHCSRYDGILQTIKDSVDTARHICSQTRIQSNDGGATATLSFAMGKWIRCLHGHVCCQEEGNTPTGQRQEPRCPKCSK